MQNNELITTGQKFHRWTVVGSKTKSDNGTPYWPCRCECGTERTIKQRSLIKSLSKSCGRCNSLIPPTLKQRGYTTKISREIEYRIWSGMRQRCYDPKRVSYPRYGGRGIKICQRWLDSYENFLDDMGRRPTPEHSIDRINSNGDYSPENCRWATRNQQNENRDCVKLNPAILEKIYQRRAEGASDEVIAMEFGIKASSVRRVINGELWRDFYRMEAYRIYGQGLDALLKASEQRGYDKGYADALSEKG